MTIETYRDTNRALWAGWTALHEHSRFYDLASVRAGRISLSPIELGEVGDVRGKSLLHLQCHLGDDSLSWARLGARVTGVDFSPEAVAVARALAAELHLDADFVCSDVYDVPHTVPESFDIVFTSYGAIPWLHDLTEWAGIIHQRLRPGGTFYIAEFHPLLYALDTDGKTVKHDYLSSPQPIHYVEHGSYAEPDADFAHPCYIWSHGLAEVIDAVIEAGLVLEFVHEHEHSPYGSFPFLERQADGMWVLKGGHPRLPLLFSLRAHRP